MNTHNIGVSLVLCCYNSASRLPKTLAHIAAQEVPNNIPWEVILVDNASTDSTSGVAKSNWPDDAPVKLRLVHENQPGLSYARHRGAQEAKFEYISFIDDDNWIDANWVATVYSIMRAHPEIGACGGKALPVFEEDPPNWIVNYYSMLALGEQEKEEGDITDSRGWLWGAGLTTRKQFWEKICQLEWQSLLEDRKASKLTSGGDVELCYWLRILGWRLFYSPKLSLKHYIPKQRLNWSYQIRMNLNRGKTIIVGSIYQHNFRNRNQLQNYRIILLWCRDLWKIFQQLPKQILLSIYRFRWTGNQNLLVVIKLFVYLVNLIKLGPIGYLHIYKNLESDYFYATKSP